MQNSSCTYANAKSTGYSVSETGYFSKNEHEDPELLSHINRAFKNLEDEDDKILEGPISVAVRQSAELLASQKPRQVIIFNGQDINVIREQANEEESFQDPTFMPSIKCITRSSSHALAKNLFKYYEVVNTFNLTELDREIKWRNLKVQIICRSYFKCCRVLI
jgi:hypothetical protein